MKNGNYTRNKMGNKKMRLIFVDNRIIENFPVIIEDDTKRPDFREICDLAHLNSEERDLLTRYYVKKQNQKKIADEMGLSQGWVSKKLTKAYNKVKLVIDRYGYIRLKN